MKITRFLLFLIICSGVFLCVTPINAKNKAQQVKKAYAKYLQSTDTSKENSFLTLDINKDGVPELITGYVNGESKFVCAILTYKNGKVKELANTLKKKGAIEQAEHDVSYLTKKKCLILYDGGTSNNYSMYAINKEGKLIKTGEIGYRWYDDSATIRKPQLNGKWISKKHYNKFFKKNKQIHYKYCSNTKENRDKYFCKIKSNKITNLFNSTGKEKILELKISSVKMQGDKMILEGIGRCPVDAVRSSKQRKQLENGKVKVMGKNWIAKREYDEDACITSYYLYLNRKSEKWSYVLSPVTTLLRYPDYILFDHNNRWVYKKVGKVRVVVKKDCVNSSQDITAEEAFCRLDDWKGKWCALEMKKSQVVNWLIS